MNKTLSKTLFGAATLATLVGGCTNKTSFDVNNESGNKISVNIITLSGNYEANFLTAKEDTAVEIYNSNLDKTITYFNYVATGVDVDKIRVTNHAFLGLTFSDWYSRGDKGVDVLFEEADKEYRAKINKAEDIRKLLLEVKIKDATDIPYK